jgi:hypothetical protein
MKSVCEIAGRDTKWDIRSLSSLDRVVGLQRLGRRGRSSGLAVEETQDIVCEI